MNDRIRFLLSRISEHLWIKPLVMCILSIAAVFVAKMAENTGITEFVPEITTESIETLLKIISASMLVIATFAVASMISAYASASNTATPRSFSLIITDDISQNALSTFIGAFIFSIVALIALMNGYYGKAARFALFGLTLFIFLIVIFMFVRWVDRIARLGRLGETIDKVEKVTAAALQRRLIKPNLGGVPIESCRMEGQSVYGNTVGYVQRINVTALQKYAEKMLIRIKVKALPGTFSAPGRILASVIIDSSESLDIDTDVIAEAFLIGNDRKFDDDPRFGLIVLSEIASRAMSPAVNDPGTAINIIGTLVRLFTLWGKPADDEEEKEQTDICDRVEVPDISLQDMFDDAFTAIARDGAGTIEVAVRLQKAFESLTLIGNPAMRDAAIHHARLALARAENAMDFPHDLNLVRKSGKFTNSV